MAKYALVFTETARRDIRKFDRVVQKKIGKKIWLLQENPFYNTRKLVSSDLGSYRLRVGDYRVIFDVKGNDIVIIRVGHRKEVYKF